ncbi:hypothetical protein GOBAR_DD28953 [Gossypium barbadense]|nr:hypothetical protein GOBAR_DD28953 [Gossypium barbadense]
MGNIFSFSLSLDTIITRCWDSAFLCKLEENLPALKTEVEDLKATRRDLMSRVRVAEDEKQLKRLPQVDLWLQRADRVITDADKLIVQSPLHVEKLCMGGCCSRHPRSTHKFGKQIATILQEVNGLKENGDFSDVACKPPIPSANKRPSDPTVGLESYVNQVWSCLQKDQVGIIGIYGLGGVGKTTLLNQINNKFHDTTHDYHVIWAVASQDRPIERVQDEIAKRIGLSNEGWKSIEEKAADIFNVLRKKKFALLLDDIWEWFDLTRAGVPLPTQQNCSKVIFTTRRRDVCCQMQPNMDNNIRVECLPPGEAFKLFEEKLKRWWKSVQDYLLLSLQLGGPWHPRGPHHEWKYAIEVLRQSTASVFPGVGKEMFPKLKFSYDNLADEKVKSCFLYCSLYPEDKSIEKDELIHCWIGEGLLDEHTNLSNARNRGHFIIGSLIDACLLEKQGNHRIKMHDVIRDMALWIAGESEEKFFVKSGVQLKEQPKDKKWEEIIRMSVMDNLIENLTDILACPNLQTLFLGRNRLKVIINDFFNFMPMLRVLDLSHNMNLKELPVGIGKLRTRRLRIIPQLISSFSKLQVLKMEGCCYQCSLVLEEMEHLNYLNVLTITFTSTSELEKALGFNKFISCAIEHPLYSLELSGYMVIEDVKIESNIIEGVGCFHSLRSIYLFDCNQLRDASWIIFAPHLERLFIRDCQGLEEIISEEKLSEVAELKGNSNLFSKLEFLHLHNLPKMKTIYRHALLFPQLKRITILNCLMLKKFPLNSNSAKGRRLVIEGDEGWWKDVEWEDESTQIAFFPSFKHR